MKLVPVRLKVIRPSKSRKFDVYTMEETKPVLLLSKNTPLENDSPILRYNSNFIAFIPFEQVKEFENYISDNIDVILSDPKVSKHNKMYAMYINMIHNLEQLVATKNIKFTTKLTKDIPNFIAQTINDAEALAILLTFIKNDSYNLALHMFNVGVYGTMITKMLHPELSRKKLEEIAKGYFLHDIGMLKIDKEILQKKGKYTKREFDEIKKHPIYGVEILRKELKIFSPLIEKIILQHHERRDGSGYPYGITEINEFARICAMADIFDAITSKREYKDELPKTTFEALNDNKNFFINEFGKDKYEAFIKSFHLPKPKDENST